MNEVNAPMLEDFGLLELGGQLIAEAGLVG
jgi:hypothetical protein